MKSFFKLRYFGATILLVLTAAFSAQASATVNRISDCEGSAESNNVKLTIWGPTNEQYEIIATVSTEKGKLETFSYSGFVLKDVQENGKTWQELSSPSTDLTLIGGTDGNDLFASIQVTLLWKQPFLFSRYSVMNVGCTEHFSSL
jgi:hypothetical protein